MSGGGAAKGIADRAAKDAEEETYEQVQLISYYDKYGVYVISNLHTHTVYMKSIR